MTAGEFSFYPVQERCIEAIFNDFRLGYQSVLVSCPTGAGKTVIMGGVVSRLLQSDKRSLMIAHRDVLLTQSQEKFRFVAEHMGCDPGRIGIAKKEKDLDKYDVAIASVFAAKNWTHGLAGRSLCLTDECHHSEARSWQTVYENFGEQNPNWFNLGVTATAFRTKKGECLGNTYERLSFHADLGTMINQGFLTPLKCKRIELGDVDLSRVSVKAGDFDRSELNKLINTPPHNRAVAEQTKKHAIPGKMIVFAVSMDHCMNLQNEFKKVGIEAAVISYKQTQGELDKIYKDFENGVHRALISIDKLTEGFDSPEVSNVIFTRPTLSPIIWIQGVGRALRLHPSKPFALLIDFTQNSDTLSLSIPPDLFAEEELDVGEMYEDLIEEEENKEDDKDKDKKPKKLGFVQDEFGDLVYGAINEADVDLINTEYAWSQFGNDLVLSLGIEEGGIIVHQLDTTMLQYSVFRVRPRESPEKIVGPVDKSWAMMAAHDIAAKQNTKFSQKDRDWRTLPATEGQLNLLRSLKADKVSVRGLASDLITHRFFQMHLNKYN